MRVGLRSRGLADEKEGDGDEDDDLEDQDGGQHFGFPSPLRIAPRLRKTVNFLCGGMRSGGQGFVWTDDLS